MKRSEFIERCPTGIAGFDILCNGGLVRNSANAVIGGPGSGKSIFLLQFLYNGASKYKENGLYISFEQDAIESYKDEMTMGWDLQKLEGKNSFIPMKISPSTNVQALKSELTKLIAKYDIRRICFDPINLFKAEESNEGKIRVLLYDLFALLKRLKVTVLIAQENEIVEEPNPNSKGEYIKFLSDGVIEMFSSGLGGVSDRAVRITKMRRTSHSRGPIPMEITDEGINVLSKKKNRLSS